MPTSLTRIGHGLYGFSEAALLTGVKSKTLRSWFFEKPGRRKPVLAGDYPAVDGSYAINDADAVAEWYGVSTDEVIDSVDLERRIAA